MNCRKRDGASAGKIVMPMKPTGQKPAGGVTRTSGAEPKDYKNIPETPKDIPARILKYSV